MEDSTANTATEWVFVAKSVSRLPDGQTQALRCMARAGVVAEDVADWLALALTWHQDFDDLDIARQCLAHADAKANDPDAWDQIAEVWVQIGCFPEAVKYHQAIIRFDPPRFVDDIDDPPWGFGRTSIDWARDKARSLVAEAKEELPENLNDALRSMVEAEYVAEDSRARISIAKSWKDDFGDIESAARCLDAAEEYADNCHEYRGVAVLWKDLLLDHDRGVRCLKEAERMATQIDEWQDIGDTWKRDFEDMDSYYRCLDAAGGQIEEFYSQEFRDFEEYAFADLVARDEAGIMDLGVFGPDRLDRVGTWKSECLSKHREGSNARYYSFTLTQNESVTICLTSQVNNFLYLSSGADRFSELLSRVNSSEDEDDEELDTCVSGLERSLRAGTYTLEAAAHRQGATGIFALSIYRSN